MQHEKSCGAIVYRKSHGNTEILLIKHINSGHWSFPKGHMENGETEIETAIREIKEETSVNVMIDPTFRGNGFLLSQAGYTKDRGLFYRTGKELRLCAAGRRNCRDPLGRHRIRLYHSHL